MDRTRDIRREYAYAELRRADLAEQPLDQFKSWLDHALTKAVPDATAMALATADDQGMPSVRIVLLKDFNADGFVWFSDQRSEKGRALAANPYAELLFHWRELDRQVRIRGLVHLLSEQAADDYFNSRPQASQWAAAASEQSQPIDSRAALEARYTKVSEPGEHPVLRPQSWVGFCLQPLAYEFWQGREGRLHDRFRFQRASLDAKQWAVERLQP
ncbi:MAG: pyridoxamine 5'-phosphate oxidase [Gammaproteobacteria bacterium TMED30]|jgi:pyridoxamine 5'-phosphate oxidase|nr:pyridoxamine 5'-phosphate oxidase [Gammaproteobacteria bacterium]OUU00211.1 MAG: pyridoxamine 5'-phosphate oxidase [Gammaproteobacteria bacterium TMED30]|tara:strand:+ start:49 stop:693 length:645 start_codon:yes stop_codon:yes gene_type:complete